MTCIRTIFQSKPQFFAYVACRLTSDCPIARPVGVLVGEGILCLFGIQMMKYTEVIQFRNKNSTSFFTF